MRLFAAIAVLASAQAARASDLVGPVSCRTCHAEAYRIWAASPHARALETLSAEQRKQPLCLSCHSRDEARAGQAEVSGVSCETCHGGGRFYQPAEVMRDKELAHLFGLADATPQSCMVCHGGESPSLKAFDPKEAMGRIDHWTADRASHKKSAWLDLRGKQLATWLKQ
jgi:cytochrome c554/c'-like protein